MSVEHVLKKIVDDFLKQKLNGRYKVRTGHEAPLAFKSLHRFYVEIYQHLGFLKNKKVMRVYLFELLPHEIKLEFELCDAFKEFDNNVRNLAKYCAKVLKSKFKVKEIEFEIGYVDKIR